MNAWVIKRSDGRYVKVIVESGYYGEDYVEYEEDEYVSNLLEATLYSNTDLELITNRCKYHYKDCKVVKLEIREVGNEINND